MIDDVFNKDWTDTSIKLNRADGKSDFFKPEKINYKEEYESHENFAVGSIGVRCDSFDRPGFQ